MAKIVMVDVLTTFRNRYAVAIGDDDPSEYATDTVVCDLESLNFQEFSQLHVGDQIFAHRVLTEDEYIQLFDEDNDYLKSWSREKKLSLVNPMERDINKEPINPT